MIAAIVEVVSLNWGKVKRGRKRGRFYTMSSIVFNFSNGGVVRIISIMIKENLHNFSISRDGQHTPFLLLLLDLLIFIFCSWKLALPEYLLG